MQWQKGPQTQKSKGYERKYSEISDAEKETENELRNEKNNFGKNKR